MLCPGAGSMSQLPLICKAKNSESINTDLSLQLAGQIGFSRCIFVVGGIQRRVQAGRLLDSFLSSLIYSFICITGVPAGLSGGQTPLLGHHGMTWVHCKRLSEPKDVLDEFKSKQA